MRTRTGSLHEAQRMEEKADALKGVEIITAAGHYVEAARLFALHGLKVGDPDGWAGAERCTRAAAAALDRCADFFSEQRGLTERPRPH